MPITLADSVVAIASGDPRAENLRWLRAQYGDVPIVQVSHKTITFIIERQFRSTFAANAVEELARAEPQFSAAKVVTVRQIVVLATLAAALAASFYAMPEIAAITLIAFSAVVFILNAAFRAILLWVGADEKVAASNSSESQSILEEQLPIYSILVPLYREANIITSLAKALCALDYPADRLDIKLIVEAGDYETATAADKIAADERFSVIRVPDGNPRTKPRACNYAIPFARGEFVVIFDAEDRPEPDQLRKAVAAFRSAPDTTACFQARLNFYNAEENWLTRMFALDYSLWFDFLLRGLDRLNIPMPVGGTSNHFRTDVLRRIHGWDPYNVTEDADLGIRLARMGLRVRTLDSTTFEEATNSFSPWLRQRSRWLKGYMQTWLVHMRSPALLLKHAGLGGFIGFQLFVGGTFLSALVNPLLWIVFVISQIWGISLLGAPLAEISSRVSIAGLLMGNGLFAYLAMLAPFRRGWLTLSPYGLTAPFYWLLVSIAGARAAWQLVTRPFYWEKTAHGVSKYFC